MTLSLKVNKKDAFRTFRHMDQMKFAIAADAEIVGRKAAQKYVELVKSGIGGTVTPSFVKSVSGDWDELSADWIKIKRGNNDKFWMETGGILNAVRVQVVQKSLLFINIFGGLDKFDDDEAYTRALKNEFGATFGSWHETGRPLFGPAISQFANRQPGGGGKLKDAKILVAFHNVIETAIKRVYVFSGPGVN